MEPVVTQPMKKCPKCGAIASLNTPVCVRCSHQFSSHMVSPNVLRCSHCANEATYKVSAVVRNSQWTARSSGTASGVAFDSHGMAPLVASMESVTSGSTDLAALLSPPPEPVLDDSTSRIAFNLLLGGAATVLIGVFAGPFAGALVGIGVILLIGSGVAYTKQAREGKYWEQQAQLYQATWMQQMRIWESLYYCPRCDHVYQPGTQNFAPPQQYQRLLY